LLLGGMAWLVNHIDWQHRVAYVEATDTKGRSRWKGERPGLGFRLCQSIRQLLAGQGNREIWSKRAWQQIEAVREEFAWLDTDGTVVMLDKYGEAEWWTFAGAGANATLAYALSQAIESRVTYDSFTVTVESQASVNTIKQTLAELRARDVSEMGLAVSERAMQGLKFSECLPHDLALDMLRTRLRDPAATQWVLERPVRFVRT
jgi:ATP-dependent Lhr-like helicase